MGDRKIPSTRDARGWARPGRERWRLRRVHNQSDHHGRLIKRRHLVGNLRGGAN
jgi:hypothetical protein